MLTSAQRWERQRVIEWARGLVAEPTTIFLDTETTGLGSDAEIVDIAVVDVHGHVLLDTLVRPSRPIPVESTRIHGIGDDDVRDAPPWPVVYPVFESIVERRSVVVYNAAFDRGMVAQCCRRHGLAFAGRSWHCAMKQFAQFAGSPGSLGTGRYRYHKLSEATRVFGLASGGHRARSDALACRELVLALARSDPARLLDPERGA
jgi:DNA polymerase-3 subunit epsilon